MAGHLRQNKEKGEKAGAPYDKKMGKMPELIRMTDSRYRQIVAAGELIEKNRGGRVDLLFVDRDNYPTAEMLRENAVEERIREFLPWLIYYRDVYRPDEGGTEECLRSRQCIEGILSEWLDIIPDEAVASIDCVSPKKWGNMNLERRCGAFRDLVGYYSWSEYDGFLKDLGWRRFMSYYGIRDRSGYAECEELTEDLLDVWEELHAGPVPR